MYLIFDTETTGLPKNFNASITNHENWNRCVQLAWQIHSASGELMEVKNFIIKPKGYSIPFNAAQIHGINTERAKKEGMPLEYVLNEFNKDLEKSDYLIGHNVNFDINIVGAEFDRTGIEPNSVFTKAIADLEKIKQLKEVDEERKAIKDKAQQKEKQDQIKSLEIEYGIKIDASPQNSIDTAGNWNLMEYSTETSSYTGSRLLRPSLTKLYTSLFHEGFAEAHNASADVEATTRAFLELIRTNDKFVENWSLDADNVNLLRTNNTSTFKLIGLNIEPYKPIDGEVFDDEDEDIEVGVGADTSIDISKEKYSHIHNHTSFSVLSATTEISTLINTSIEMGMPAVGITDTGNMYGAYHFVRDINKANAEVDAYNKAVDDGDEEGPKKEPVIKGIVGSEFNIAEDWKRTKFTKDNPDRRFTQVLLAKNKAGYHNIAKLSSFGHIDGMYAGNPRIGKELLADHLEGTIALTGGITAEIPSLILNIGEERAEEAFVWWHNLYGDDFYVELIRHGLEEENHVNSVLLGFALKYNVKYIAQNNTFYPKKIDADAHDILLCIRDGEKQATPAGRGRGFRFKFPNEEFYFKSQEEMKELFKDLPHSIANIKDLTDKIEPYVLAQPVLLPEFDIPKRFIDNLDKADGGKRGENAYLRFLTYEGAKQRWGDNLDPDVIERLDFELSVIAMTGYPGYFLIVQDFTTEARVMGISVGPGRGSAAGSAVAYCIGITNIDPIKYDLLFERFLNPDRVSLPDIDIDFDNEGRQRIIEFVVEKYGKNQVAQIITYGTMAAKSSIRDAGRALDLPLSETDVIAKLVPDIKLKKLFAMDDVALADKLKNNADDIQRANELKLKSKGHDLSAEVINKARVLEGSVRNTGIHACGVIITPSDIREHVPVATAKDSDLLVTQFDNSVVEDAGLLKMDFLGLKTLTLIKDAVEIIKKRHGIELIPDDFSLEDTKTYELFQRGETVGVFQYESPGMQKYLRELKPTVFADVIAMNALYRPGPLEYIPSFIKRKHGEEPIVYDIEASKLYLEETYGITVYQEQVMRLSQLLANFTKGEADMLRKAMGKKIFALLEKLKPKFLDGCEANGHNRKVAEKVWKDWEAFASYAFNKSHSTCYAYIAFQTAYLKAHYPAEYMASVLSNNMNDIKTVTFFMEECKRMGIEVLGPDVNESEYKFTVNPEGAIRFGMGAIKGVGEGAVEAIVNERNLNGNYISIFDLSKRINLQAANKKAFENLALGGGFDSFKGVHRAQYFVEDLKGDPFLAKAIKFGHNYQASKSSAQTSLFGEDSEVQIPEPVVPQCEEWGTLEKLSKEKDVVGLYITGHPLDDYKVEIENFTNAAMTDFRDMKRMLNKDVTFAGILSDVNHLTAKNGNGFGKFTVSDYNDSSTFMMFGEEYLRFKHILVEGAFLFFKTKVFQRFPTADRLTTKWINIQLLSEIMNQMVKGITIFAPLNSITEEIVMELHEMIASHPGSHKISFKIFDLEEKIELDLNSRERKIRIDKDFINYIDQIPEITYKLV
ncbi:MAG: DNA polymerase III subunit alpha [Ichthyobacteriaceae bacterium]|nr:DNA polymerase III subunit alpha [Ichthyobacteriaceae bacterium]